MDVTLALLCDSANVSTDGKLNVLGQFDTISAQAFPIVHPMMHLVLRFSATPAEAGQDRTLSIRLVNADGNVLGEISGPLSVPESLVPGRSPVLQMIVPFQAVTFPEAGSYALHIIVDQDDKRSVALSLAHVSDPTEVADAN